MRVRLEIATGDKTSGPSSVGELAGVLRGVAESLLYHYAPSDNLHQVDHVIRNAGAVIGRCASVAGEVWQPDPHPKPYRYTLVDEDDHGALQSELEGQAWDDDGRRDFRKALTQMLDEHYEGEHEIPDDEGAVASDFAPTIGLDLATWSALLTELWHKGCDVLNVNGGSGYDIGTGQVVCFRICEWFEKLARARSGRATELDAAIAAIAEASRIRETE